MGHDVFEGPFLLIPIFVLILLVACFCFCCPCCPWYKRRNQGTVYQNITRPPGTTIEVISSQNTTGYPITHQVNIAPQPVAYPAQQMAYPPQQGVYPPQQGVYPPQQGVYPPQQGVYPPQQGVYPPQQAASQGVYPPQPVCLPAQPAVAMPPTGAAYSMPGPYPEHNVQPNFPPYGQPPPYSEVAHAPASAPRVEEAYAKQAPFNPNYSGN